jgi:hypothetical protein
MIHVVVILYLLRWGKEQHPARERFFAFNHRGYLRPRLVLFPSSFEAYVVKSFFR